MKLKIFILFVIIALIYLQYQSINNFNNNIGNNLEILQINNPNKEKFEETVNKKCISIFTNITNELLNLQDICIEDLKNLNDADKKNFNSKLQEHYNYYSTPLCIKNEFNIKIENDKYHSNITFQSKNRLLMSQVVGTKKIYLFSPNQDQYLYINKNNKSDADFFNQDLVKYPLLSKSKYIEIILRPGQMIYIPYQWLYCYENINDNAHIICNSESLFSYFLKSK